MADPTPPSGGVSLLDNIGTGVSDFGQGLMSLLAPLVSGGQVTSGSDPGAVPAFLAFASKMAQAGAPSLGPRTPLLTALPEAEGAGYTAAAQGRMLPYLGAQAALETAKEKTALDAAQFDLNQRKALFGLTMSQVPLFLGGATGTEPAPGQPGGATPGSAPGPGGAGGPGTPAPAAAGGAAATPPLSPQQISALPDVQQLPDSLRLPFATAVSQVGMAPDEAALYARMVKQESQGEHIDPKTGNVLTSSAGAQGVAQVMPGTFATMATKYGIQGSNTDLMPNLLAGAHYFHEGVMEDGAHNAVVRYDAGPDGLQTYLRTGVLPDETTKYLAAVNAPPGPTQVAGPGAPAAAPVTATPLPAPSNQQQMVFDPVSRQSVPAGILASAQAAARAALMAGNVSGMGAAYNAEIGKWQQQRAAEGTVVPSGPGMGTKSTTGEVIQQPVGATVASPLTPDELAKFAPNKIPGMDYVGERYVDGPLAGQLKGPPTVLAPRSAGLPFQQANDVQQALVRQPAMQNWQNAQSRYDLLMQALNQRTRPGDEGAILALGKIFDPSAVVHEGRIEMAQQFGGLQQQLQEFLGSITGASGMPDNVRQQVADLATSEMATRDSAALQQIQQSRDFAKANGVDPNRIMPSFRTSALSADGAGAYAGMPGVTYSNPYQWDQGQTKFLREEVKAAPAAQPARVPVPPALPAASPGAPSPAPPGGAQGGPGAGATVAPPATPAPATAPPGATAGAAPANRLTERAMGQMSGQGLLSLGQDMKAHPDRYTDADRDAYIAHMHGRTQ